jgi:hypothetical protein
MMMLSKTPAVLEEIFDERRRQENLFPDQHLPNGTTQRRARIAQFSKEICENERQTGTLTWRHVLEEEFDEALCEEDEDRLREELVQVAAVAVRWIEDIDLRRSQ